MKYSISSNSIDIICNMPEEMSLIDFNKIEVCLIQYAETMIENSYDKADFDGYITAIDSFYWFYKGKMNIINVTFNKYYFEVQPFTISKGGEGKKMKYVKKKDK